MPRECNDTNCTKESCEGCASRAKEQTDFSEPMNKFSNIKNVIGVVSGKGGVGKSLVTSLLAIEMEKRGYKTAVLDADITGPSIPKIFGIHATPESSEEGLKPAVSSKNIKIMSTNLILEHETDPVIWRGPVIANMVRQFWSEVYWGEIDYMFVDMPPGTGDVPLTVYQSLPVNSIVIVASPQELVQMIVEKAVRMAELMKVKVAGIVENMSYLKCPDCGKEISVFGESRVEELAKKYQISNFAKLPIDSEAARLCDKGRIEELDRTWLKEFTAGLIDLNS
ncbi:MAG: Mrp/NBP35 family ATP-binding protein [Lachnospiraceae bacterium]|nr:Mrp/NBP35 family ATP-binding protein [Lachnospiraceae bacterium]